jgi:hypothetical protein
MKQVWNNVRIKILSMSIDRQRQRGLNIGKTFINAILSVMALNYNSEQSRTLDLFLIFVGLSRCVENGESAV